VAIGDEAGGLLLCPEIPIRQTEDPNGGVGKGIALCGTTPNGVILGEDDPVIATSIAEPDLIGEELTRPLAVRPTARKPTTMLLPRLRSTKNSRSRSGVLCLAIAADYRTQAAPQAAARVATRMTSST
jgi:hypothetical protein